MQAWREQHACILLMTNNMKMNRKMKSHNILITGMLILLLAPGCRPGQKDESSVPAVGVHVLSISSSKYVAPVHCTGRLSTKTESKLSFKTGGIINRILADEGQSVNKGQLLAELNLEEIRSRVNQAELVLRKAERDFRRSENLYRDSVVTLEQYENARTALDVARANQRIARFNLQYSTIRAPADGKILKRIAEADEIVGPGHPVFLFASTQSDWVVRTSLTDRDVVRVNMLDSARIFFDAYRGEVFMGLVSEIGTAADPYTGTYEIEIQMLSKPVKPVSGFIARVELYPRDEEDKILIPFESMIDGAGLSGYVYVVEDGKPHRRKIGIESFSDRGIIVGSGLKEGETIVIEGAQYLREESRIRIIDTDQ